MKMIGGNRDFSIEFYSENHDFSIEIPLENHDFSINAPARMAFRSSGGWLGAKKPQRGNLRAAALLCLCVR